MGSFKLLSIKTTGRGVNISAKKKKRVHDWSEWRLKRTAKYQPIRKGYILTNSNYVTFLKRKTLETVKRLVVSRDQRTGRDAHSTDDFQGSETILLNTLPIYNYCILSNPQMVQLSES